LRQKNSFFIELKDKTKIVTPLLALVLATIMVGTTIILPLQALNAQTITVKRKMLLALIKLVRV